jgi:hypothetical protein
VEVRRVVISEVHVDHDSVELAEPRHPNDLRRPAILTEGQRWELSRRIRAGGVSVRPPSSWVLSFAVAMVGAKRSTNRRDCSTAAVGTGWFRWLATAELMAVEQNLTSLSGLGAAAVGSASWPNLAKSSPPSRWTR